MANKVLLKRSATSGAGGIPSTSALDYGELALNYADGKLYYKTSSNTIKSFTEDSSVVTLTGTQTLSNKTLTSPTINSATANNLTLTGTLTAGGGTGTSGQVLSSTGTGVQWISVSGTGTVTSITAGTGLTGGTITSSGTIAIDSTVVTLTDTQTLTNKTLTSPVISTIVNTGTLTLPTSTDTLVGRATTDTLTNKTLTSPTISGGTIDNAVIGGTTAAAGTFTNLTVTGDLTVNGTTTTVNSTTVTVDDKNIELGSVASPTNTTADGGGITLKGTTDKTLNWVNATGAWTSSEDFNLLTGKVYEINGVTVLSSTQVLGKTLPTGDVVGSSDTQTLTNKTLTDSTTFFQDETDNSKKLQFQLSGIATATTRTLTIPNASGTIALTSDIPADTNTTYSISAETTTGGADLRLTGSDSTTDNVKIAGGTNVTVTRTDANTITISADDTSVDWSEIQNKPDPVITLAGDLTGSVTLTDLTSGTLTATIAANSVALGTDTTGNYVGSIADGSPGAQTGTSGLTISAVAGENTSATIAHADTSSVSNLSSDNSNGIVLQDISFTFDGFGHVTAASVATTDLDSRYVNTSGDTMTGFLTLHADPTSALHAVTKQYVDTVAQGLHTHAPCVAATDNTLASITGGTITYNNGTAGVGATLTVSGGTFGTIDGVNIATVGTRILVKNEATAANNGIYTYTNSTTLTRATDFDTPTEMAGGDFTFVQQGTLYNDTGWVLTDPVTTVGTTAATFAQFSGAGTYTAGAGLTLNGTQFSHTDTSSAANLTATSRTYVTGLTFDTFGHVTAYTTASETVTDTNTTYTLDGSGTTNSVNIELVAGGSGSGTDSINVVGSGATTVSWDEGNQRITISSTDTNTTYSAATSTTLGLIELFSDTQQSVAANAVSATASRTYGLQINASGQGVINVPWTDTTYSAATSTTLGLIELFSDTQQSVAANSVTSTASRTYGLQVNAAGQGVINVPWTDTTYSAATSTALGLIELGSDTVQTVASNAVSATASRSYALQINAAGQGVINVPWTDTTYSAATSTTLGLIELFSDTQQSTAANAVTSTASRTYGLQVNASGQGVINVPWTDTTYSAATSTVLGLIELGSDTVQTTAANAVTTTASRSYALQVNASGQGVINVPWTDTTYSQATSSTLGLIKLGSDTQQTVAANAVTTTASRTYAVQVNASGQAVVNVPWVDTDTDTNTTYSISAETVAGGANLRLTGSDASTDNVTLAAGSNITITRTDANTITIASTGGGGGSWSVKTSNYTAASGDQLLANTSGGSFTITLPATPSAGNSVVIADGNNWQTNNLTVARNGSTIKGLSEDLILNIAGVKVDFVYSGSTWCVFAFASGGEDPLAAALAIGDEL